jgi:uncharacterized membrane protein YccC
MQARNLPITLDLRAVSLSEGLRAGIAIACTLIIGQIFDLPRLGLAALGALLTCFADPGGPIARRIPAVASFTILSGLSFAAFGYLRGQSVWLALPAASAMIFCTSFARVYGQGGMQVGNLLSVVTVLAIGFPMPHLLNAAAQGLNFSAGAAWAAVLTLVIWRIHPYSPARRALGRIAETLAVFSRELATLAAGAETVQAFDTHAAQNRRAVREAIETARMVALETFRRRGLVSQRAAQVSVRLQSLEQVFGALIALSDTLENDARVRAGIVAPLVKVAAWLEAMVPLVRSDKPLEISPLTDLLSDLQQLTPPAGEARACMLSIAESLAVMLSVATPTGQGLEGATAPQSLRRRLASPVRQNLSWDSAPMRHAARTAVIATPVLGWTTIYGGPFSHWATITMVLCLQPYFSATWLRAAERIVGTAVGGVVAAGIGFFARSELVLAGLMLPLAMLAFSIRAVSFGAFIAVITPLIVLLIEQIVPGTDELHVALARIGYTVAGGGLAIAGTALLWPDFEGAKLEAPIGRAVAAHAAWLNAVFAMLLDGAPRPDGLRRAAGLASNNLEAAVARALLEPRSKRDKGLARATVIDAALRRMAGRLAVLSLDMPQIPDHERPVWETWQVWLNDCFSNNVSDRPPLPDGPGREALTRLARQIDLILSC